MERRDLKRGRGKGLTLIHSLIHSHSNFPTNLLCLSSPIPTLLSLPTWTMSRLISMALPSKKRSGRVDNVIERGHHAKKALFMSSTKPWIDPTASLASAHHEFGEPEASTMATAWSWSRPRSVLGFGLVSVMKPVWGRESQSCEG